LRKETSRRQVALRKRGEMVGRRVPNKKEISTRLKEEE